MSFTEELLGIFFSNFCAGCGSKVRKMGLCEACNHQLTPRTGGRCGVCDLAFGTPDGGHTCRRCLLRRPVFDRVFGIFEYSGPAGRIVRRSKYSRCPELLGWLGARSADALPSALLEDPPSAVIPVPVHWKRRLNRHFDAPLWCAQPIANALQAPLMNRTLRRTRATPLQTGLSDAERRRNVRGAFALQAQPPRDVLLVDDVFTTGSTVDAVSRCLKQGGCHRVRVIASAYVDPADVGSTTPDKAARTTVA